MWPGLVGGLVGRVVEGVGEEMSRLMACVSQWSRWGGVQAQVDLAALTTVLHSHTSPAARLVMHCLLYAPIFLSFLLKSYSNSCVIAKGNFQYCFSLCGRF